MRVVNLICGFCALGGAVGAAYDWTTGQPAWAGIWLLAILACVEWGFKWLSEALEP